jgi:hypothetical protein
VQNVEALSDRRGELLLSKTTVEPHSASHKSLL